MGNIPHQNTSKTNGMRTTSSAPIPKAAHYNKDQYISTQFSSSIDKSFYYSSSTEDSSIIYKDKIGKYRVWKIYIDLLVNDTKDLQNKLNKMDKLEEKLNEILDLEQNYFIVSHRNGKHKAVKIEIAVKISTKVSVIQFIDEQKYDLKRIFFHVFGNDPCIDIYSDFNKYSPSNNTATTLSNISLTDFVLNSSPSRDNNKINNYNKRKMNDIDDLLFSRNSDSYNEEKKNKMFVPERVKKRNVLFDNGCVRISYLNAMPTPTTKPNVTCLIFTIENLSEINARNIVLKVHQNNAYKNGEYILSKKISNKISGNVKKIQLKHFDKKSGNKKRKILEYQIMINGEIKSKISRCFIGKEKAMKPTISPSISITPNVDNAGCYDDADDTFKDKNVGYKGINDTKEILNALRRMNKKLEDADNSLSEMIGTLNNINNIQSRLING